MTISSAFSVQGNSQDSLVDSIPKQGVQDYSPVSKQDASIAESEFQNHSLAQKDLAKVEQRQKTEPDTWDKLSAKAEYASGYLDGLIPLNELRDQSVANLGVKTPLIESPHYRAGHESGKEDIKEGLTYVFGFADGINPMTPIADALAESLHIERQHAGKESTYWKGRSDGAAVGVMVDGTIMASGGGMMLGSGACEVGTGGVCTVVAAPAFATGVVLAGGGTASMVSHTGMYAEAQQQYLQSRAKENTGSSKTQSKPEPAKSKSPEDVIATKSANVKGSIQENSLKAFKTLVNKLSKPNSKITQAELNKLRVLTQKHGGRVRVDLTGVKGTSVKPHAHIEGLGKSLESRHIWLESGVK
ncbi:MAG: hypothetical protein H7A32_04945 [Deltaproteobacteria bacterium]|nr:hypothetical protein [Deltaproteobacteria bacterium]